MPKMLSDAPRIDPWGPRFCRACECLSVCVCDCVCVLGRWFPCFFVCLFLRPRVFSPQVLHLEGTFEILDWMEGSFTAGFLMTGRRKREATGFALFHWFEGGVVQRQSARSLGPLYFTRISSPFSFSAFLGSHISLPPTRQERSHFLIGSDFPANRPKGRAKLSAGCGPRTMTYVPKASEVYTYIYIYIYMLTPLPGPRFFICTV